MNPRPRSWAENAEKNKKSELNRVVREKQSTNETMERTHPLGFALPTGPKYQQQKP